MTRRPWQGRTPVTGVRVWLGGAAVLLGLWIGLGTLEALVAPGGWLPAAVVAAGVVLLAAALTRAVGPSEWAPVSALVAGVLVVAIGYGGADGPGLSGWSTPGRLAELISEGVRTINEGRIPVVADRGLELLVVLGAVAAAVVIDALALGLRLPGAAGIALATVWAPTLVFERPPSTVSLIGGATLWLLLVWLTRRTTGRDPGPWRELPVAAAVAASVAIGGVLLGPLASAVPGYGTVRLPATWGPGLGGGGSITLSDDLDLRADLGGRSGTEVLRYTSDLADVGPLRTQTLTEFDGTRWAPGERGVATAVSGVVWPQAVEGEVAGSVNVTVTRLDQGELPIPLGPRSLSVTDGWSYDPVRDEVAGPVQPGLTYRAEVLERDLSPEALRAAGSGTLPDQAAELAVPDSAYGDQIAELAQEVAGDEATTYDQAMALQSWFRGTDFVYRTQLPPAQTSDAVWDFLQVKAGYCVQYATAMVVMARDLGIPARVGVGFLPGQRDAAGTVTVGGDRAHAWPELYFEGTGWVRFEPTPAVQAGAPPAYADPAVTSLEDEPDLVPSLQPDDESTPSQPAEPSQSPGASGGIQTGGAPLWPWLVGGAGLVAVGVWLVRRRSQQWWGPEEAWSLLRREAAGLGVTWADSATPRTVGEQLREALRARSTDPFEAEHATDELVAVLEAHRYSPLPGTAEPADMLAWVSDVTAGLSAGRADAPSAPRRG